jgi:hypothetical protein
MAAENMAKILECILKGELRPAYLCKQDDDNVPEEYCPIDFSPPTAPSKRKRRKGHDDNDADVEDGDGDGDQGAATKQRKKEAPKSGGIVARSQSQGNKPVSAPATRKSPRRQ